MALRLKQVYLYSRESLYPIQICGPQIPASQLALRLQLIDLVPQPRILLLQPLPGDYFLSPLSHEKDRANREDGQSQEADGDRCALLGPVHRWILCLR